jgi:hypothetical protein
MNRIDHLAVVGARSRAMLPAFAMSANKKHRPRVGSYGLSEVDA